MLPKERLILCCCPFLSEQHLALDSSNIPRFHRCVTRWYDDDDQWISLIDSTVQLWASRVRENRGNWKWINEIAKRLMDWYMLMARGIERCLDMSWFETPPLPLHSHSIGHPFRGSQQFLQLPSPLSILFIDTPIRNQSKIQYLLNGHSDHFSAAPYKYHNLNSPSF